MNVRVRALKFPDFLKKNDELGKGAYGSVAIYVDTRVKNKQNEENTNPKKNTSKNAATSQPPPELRKLAVKSSDVPFNEPLDCLRMFRDLPLAPAAGVAGAWKTSFASWMASRGGRTRAGATNGRTFSSASSVATPICASSQSRACVSFWDGEFWEFWDGTFLEEGMESFHVTSV